jgi:hypothetical protein
MNSADSTQNAILERAINPKAGNWSASTAHSLLEIKLTDRDLARADELARKAGEGTLSDAELAELNSFRHAGRVLEMLKAKARISLKRTGVA